jgi:hypothetical protein
LTCLRKLNQTALGISTVVLNNEYVDVPEPETILMVIVFHWSDGTAAPNQVLH